MHKDTTAEAATAVIRRNTAEVQGRGDFAPFGALLADDYVDHTSQRGALPAVYQAAFVVSLGQKLSGFSAWRRPSRAAGQARNGEPGHARFSLMPRASATSLSVLRRRLCREVVDRTRS